MAETETRLSRSMEDYLEAIYNLKLDSHVARVKDIAQTMNVKMPSVTEAIRSLVSKGLVRHQPYESIELTPNGLAHAQNIARRHSAVKDFLTGVLGVSDSNAEDEACHIEHAIQPDTLDKLLKLADFVRACDGDKSLRLDHFQHYMKYGEYPDECATVPGHSVDGNGHQHRHGGPHHTSPSFLLSLSQLSPGTHGRIARISGHGPIRKRLLEMGMTSGTPFEVVRVAPLGDPIEIKVRGYYLSLRKNEAERISVEL